MITLTTANASAALLSSDALALLDSLEEATGDEDAAIIAVKFHAPSPHKVVGGYTPCP